MRVLSIGTDPRIFNNASPSARRMAAYGELVERYGIIARAERPEPDVWLSPRVPLYAARTSRALLFVVAALRAATRARRDGPWDVVTAENPFDVGLAAWLIARRLGAAFHLQVHGDFFGSKEWRRERPTNRLRLVLARFLARRADGIRVVSERIARSLTADRVPRELITVAPIFEDVQALARDCRVTSKSPIPLVLFVGRLEKEKNPLLALDAFASVRRTVPDVRLRFVGIGSLLSGLRRRTDELGVANAVEFVPWTDNLAPHYGAAHVLVISSNHEGWGRIVIEAAACRLPVVMTDVGAAGELVRDGENGWVVPVGDAERLAAAITDVLKHPDESSRRAHTLEASCSKLRETTSRALLRQSWQRAYDHRRQSKI